MKEHFDKCDYDHILDIFPNKRIEEKKPLNGQKKGDIFAIIVCLVFALLGIILYQDLKELATPTIFLFGLGFIVLLWKFLKSIKL